MQGVPMIFPTLARWCAPNLPPFNGSRPTNMLGSILNLVFLREQQKFSKPPPRSRASQIEPTNVETIEGHTAKRELSLARDY